MSDAPAPAAAPRRPPVDWDDVRRRVDQLRLTIERGWTPEPDEAARILRQRARALAQPPAAQAGAGLEVIEFSLGEERYGIESSAVREVFPLTELARVPCTPPFVLGIINVRGEIVSVVDLKKFFDLPGQSLTDLNRVLLLEGRGMLFGILADRLLGVRSLAAGALQSGLPTLGGSRADYLKGLTDERLAVLDADKLLGDPRLVVYETVEDAPNPPAARP